MKRVFSLFLALVMLTGLCSLTALGADKPSAEATKATYEAAKTYFEKAGSKKNMLSLEEVLAAAEAGDSLLIDIRGAEDYAKGHLKGAVNIPFVQVVNYLDQLPRDKRIIVNCFSGQTAGQIVGSLSLAGFNAYSLSGGAGSFTDTTPLETTAHEFVPASNAELTANEKLLLEAARYAMTIPEGKNVIQPTDLVKDLSKYFILDVRTVELFAKGHIEGATLIPYLEMGANLDKLPKDKTIAVVCNSGQQSSQTVAVLKAAGFSVLNVQSGMNNGWYKNDLPVVRPQEAAYEAAKTYFSAAMTRGKNMLPLEDVLKIADAGTALILDIRGAEDYAKGHLKGAVNIPFVEVSKYINQLPRDKRIIVCCYSGQTAGQIVGSLRLAGFDAYTLSGGAGSFTADTKLETKENKFVPATNRKLTANEQLLMDAIAYSITIPADKNVIQTTDLAKDTSKYFILDVRTQELYDAGHIEGATLIPYAEMGDNLDKLAELAKDKTIAVVCNSGQQSSQTVAVLKAAGFTVLNVQSGMNNGWYKNDLPVVKAEKEEPAPAPVTPTVPAGSYVVQAGDSLWKIAKNLLGTGTRWDDIFEANKATIKDPAKISVGQILVIPA